VVNFEDDNYPGRMPSGDIFNMRFMASMPNELKKLFDKSAIPEL
jgi:hypothetical protein